jgi:thiol-disulfide isomerase/thioredoxin
MFRFGVMVLMVLLFISPAFAGGRREEATNPEERGADPTTESTSAAETAPERGTVPMDEDTAEILFALGMSPFQNRIPSEDFILPMLQGGGAALSDYRGQVVFLNFWATWCPPCREEMPSMQLLYDELSDEGLEILAIDVQEPQATVKAFVDEFGFSFPVLLDENGRVAMRYSVRAFPTTYIIDREGNLLGVRPGYHDWSAPEMIASFRELLAQP